MQLTTGQKKDKYLAAWYKEKGRPHQVTIRQKVITHPRKERAEIPIVGDDGDVLTQIKSLNNKVAELVQVQKEMLILMEKVVETRGAEPTVRVKVI